MYNIKNMFAENKPSNGLSTDEAKVVSPKEIIIIAVLAVIFVGVLAGAFWDLYGRNLLCNCNCSNQIANQRADGLRPGDNGSSTPKIKNGSSSPAESGKNQNGNPPPVKTDTNIDSSLYQTCLSNAKDLGASKDCCDCLSADVSVRKACRDAAATYDFTKNTEIKQFTIPSKLGRTGDYSTYTASGNQQECKQKCDTSTTLVCGDFQFCRTACDGLSN